MGSLFAILLSFLNLCLYIAIILFIAWVIVWLLEYLFSITLSGEVLRWGKIIVALLCLIAIVAWLASVLGGTPSAYFPLGRRF